MKASICGSVQCSGNSSHAAEDAQTSGDPFVLLFLLGKQREQHVLHQLDQFRAVPHHLERVEPVRPFRPVETDIVELVRIPVPFNEVVGGTGIVRILEVIDESGESQPHVFAQKPFSDTFRLSGTGPSVNQEVGVMVIEFEPGLPDS